MLVGMNQGTCQNQNRDQSWENFNESSAAGRGQSGLDWIVIEGSSIIFVMRCLADKKMFSIMFVFNDWIMGCSLFSILI